MWVTWTVFILGLHFSSSQHQIIPLSEIYKNSSLGDDLLLNPAVHFKYEDYYLCLNSTNDKGKYCSCQPQCLSYGACCLDYLWYQKKWNNINDYLRELVRKQNHSCQPIVRQQQKVNGKNNVKMNIQFIKMIASCPGKMIDSQTSTVKILPVFGSDKNVYVNPSTAECHGVNQYTLLLIEAECNNAIKNTSASDLEFTECNYRVEMTENLTPYIHKCIRKNSCKFRQGDTNKLNAELCESYKGKVVTGNAIYNNIHCTLCSESKDKILIAEDTHKEDIFGPMPYSTIISYRKGQAIATNSNKNKKKMEKELGCTNHEIYDVVERQCIPFICSKGFKQKGFQCTREQPKDGDENEDDDEDVAGSLLDDVITHLNKCMSSKRHQSHIVLYAPFDSPMNFTSTLLRHGNDFTRNISSGKQIFIIALKNKTMMALLKELNATLNGQQNEVNAWIVSSQLTETEMYHYNITHSFPKGRMCYKPVKQSLSTLKIDRKCNLEIANESFPTTHYVTRVNLLNRSDVIVSTCQQYHLYDKCVKKIIPTKNYTLFSNGTISVTSSHTIYHVSQYTPMSQGVGVCAKRHNTAASSSPKSTWSDIELAEGYLTIVACLVSIVFYCMTIVVYMRTKELREIPGKNIVCTCIVLLLSDVFIIIAAFVNSSNSAFACYVLATLLHFFLLSVQTWSTVISFEIWFTLRKHTSARFIYSPKRFLLYCGYAFTFPLVTILLFGTLDSTKTLAIGYGRYEGYCWIGSFYFRIFLYLLPIGLASSYNISVLVFILYQMYAQQRQSKKLLKKTGGQDEVKIVKTALKLIMLLGLVELVGFLQIPTGATTKTDNWVTIFNFTTRFLFTFMRGFRGLFIWILFVYMDKRAWFNQRCKRSSDSSPHDTPTMATKSSRVSYKITNNLLYDTKF